MLTPNSHRSHLCESHREEIASMLTHAAGLLFSLCALAPILVLADGSGVKFVGALVFGVWHLFVLAGCACHVLAACRFVF